MGVSNRSLLNVFFKVSKILCTFLLLFTASDANASPIVTLGNSALRVSVCSADIPTSIVRVSDDFVGPINFKLADFACESLRSPIYSADLNKTKFDNVKSLPAVPTAALMVLIGFICISLVKDRRIWSAVLAVLLSASQTGVHAVPQLVMRLSQRIHSRPRETYSKAVLYLCSKIGFSDSSVQTEDKFGVHKFTFTKL